MNVEFKNNALNDEELENVTGGVIGTTIYDENGNEQNSQDAGSAYYNRNRVYAYNRNRNRVYADGRNRNRVFGK